MTIVLRQDDGDNCKINCKIEYLLKLINCHKSPIFEYFISKLPTFKRLTKIFAGFSHVALYFSVGVLCFLYILQIISFLCENYWINNFLKIISNYSMKNVELVILIFCFSWIIFELCHLIILNIVHTPNLELTNSPVENLNRGRGDYTRIVPEGRIFTLLQAFGLSFELNEVVIEISFRLPWWN